MKICNIKIDTPYTRKAWQEIDLEMYILVDKDFELWCFREGCVDLTFHLDAYDILSDDWLECYTDTLFNITGVILEVAGKTIKFTKRG